MKNLSINVAKTTTKFPKQSLRQFSKKNLLKSALLTLAISTTGLTGAMMALPTSAQASVAVTDFSDLVEQVSPSVARVNVIKKISEEELAKVQTAVLLRKFFGDRVNIPESATIPAVERSYGTAFFVTADGYMLTNHHVVEGADSITITLNDRRELDVKVIGSDKSSDVAVLKVVNAADTFPALPMGNSDSIRVGEPVLAIGSPFGFDYSASAGIVSAKSRNFSRQASVPFIQTDVAINPGNSGGPLFNKKGEVIGINSRIFSGTGGFMGLSFSIPIDEALNVYQQLKTNGKVVRAYMGVTSQNIDRNLAEAFGLSKPQGALIAQVSTDSPAHQAGLKLGDIVLAMDGTKIISADELSNRINRAHPNDDFKVTVLRAGKQLQLTGKYGTEPTDIQAGQSSDHASNGVKLGLKLRVLSPREVLEFRKYMRVTGGVLITAVDPTGLAGRSGLQSGDIITNLNHHPITDIKSFTAAHDSLPRKGVVMLEVIRAGVPAIVGLRIE